MFAVELYVSFIGWFNSTRTEAQLGFRATLGTAGHTQSKTGLSLIVLAWTCAIAH